MAPKSNGQSAAGKPPSKMDAVRAAIATLGRNAKPGEIQAYVKDNYKIAMSLEHISNYKSSIVKHLGGRRRGRRRRIGAKPGPKPGSRRGLAAAPAAGRGEAALVHDLATVRALAERHGAATLKGMIDVMFK